MDKQCIVLYHSVKSATIRNRIMDRVYVRTITHSTKSSILLGGAGVWKISSVTCGFSSIKIDYFDFPKR